MAACALSLAFSGAIHALTVTEAPDPQPSVPQFLVTSVDLENGELPYGMLLSSKSWLSEAVSSGADATEHRVLFVDVAVYDSEGLELATVSGPIVVDPSTDEAVSSGAFSVFPIGGNGEPVDLALEVVFIPKQASTWGSVTSESSIDHLLAFPSL